MSRVPDIPTENMTEEQKRIAFEIGAARGGVVRGPFAIWLRQPELADAANKLGNALRLGKLELRLLKLAILLVARRWNAQYEWFAHAESAVQAGLAHDIVEAIRTGATPNYRQDDERTVAAVIGEINSTGKVSDSTYADAERSMGLDLLIELVSVTGFYTMVAVVLNAFDAPLPEGQKPLLTITDW